MIPAFLVDLLSAHLKRAPASEFVFCTRDGSPIRRSKFRQRVWKPALKKSGLDPNLRFHDLRHTCASLPIEQGAHPKEIQARLGHSSITTTLDRYGHLMPSLGHQLAANLDEMRTRARSDVDQNVDQRRCGGHRTARTSKRKRGSTCGFGGWAVLGSNQSPLRCKG